MVLGFWWLVCLVVSRLVCSGIVEQHIFVGYVLFPVVAWVLRFMLSCDVIVWFVDCFDLPLDLR